MPKITVHKTIELPSDYKPYVYRSMHGSDGPGVHLMFTEDDGTDVTVRVPVTPLLIERLKDTLKEFNAEE